MKVRTILFDLGDTLIRLHPLPELPTLLAPILARQRGILPTEAMAMATQLVEQLGRQLAAESKAGVTEEPGLGALIAPLIDAEPEELAEIVRQFGEADVSRFEFPATGLSRIERFKTLGFCLGIVSNTTTSPDLLDEYLRGVGLLPLFDCVVYSVAKGQRKPHPELYRLALREIGAEADSTVFVGDRVREDVLGPRAVGMRAVLTQEFRQEPPAGSTPLAVITRLEELEDVLSA
ncbi:MAG: HAD family hydrolase [Anaerolineaceae bacterium]